MPVTDAKISGADQNDRPLTSCSIHRPLRLIMFVPGIGITEFERHKDVFRAFYLWAREVIIAQRNGASTIAAILATGKKTKQPAKGT